jgi:pyruvate dehydrogenase E2 component (dihydrolipoamide acetyltransferase)
MQREVLLPQVELTMESVLIARWLVRAGERVSAQQPILEVETQKATSEVPSPAAGFVRQLCVEEGQSVGEKAVLCILTDTADEPFALPDVVSSAPARSEIVCNAGQPAGAVDDTSLVKASPAARRVARELGVELSALRGTGPGGRITEDDVRSAGSAAAGKAANVSGTDANGAWRTLPASRAALIAQMQKSLAEIPQFHVRRQMEVTPLLAKADGITFTHRLA